MAESLATGSSRDTQRNRLPDVSPGNTGYSGMAKDDLDATIKANVKHVVDALRSATPILKPKVDSDEIKVLGATYSLDTGFVSFLNEK